MNKILKRLMDACAKLPKTFKRVTDDDIPKMRRKPSMFNIDKPIFSIEGDEHWYSRPTIAMRCWHSLYGHINPDVTTELVKRHCKRTGSECDCIAEVAGVTLCSTNQRRKK